MKIIFLDIDGVLNTERNLRKHLPHVYINRPEREWIIVQLDKGCIENLNKITDSTGAGIIISSNWREQFLEHDAFDVLIEYLKVQGVSGGIIGHTPVLELIDNKEILVSNKPRGYQISLWLREHGNKIENFVALDDSLDMEPVKDNWVQCYAHNGITKEVADSAIRMLNSLP